MTGPVSTSRVLFPRSSWPEATRIAALLRRETVGGALLLVATVIALVWANSPWAGAYAALRDFTVGPTALHLDLSLGVWAADGLLAIFFFVAGLELKREFVAGDLRDPRRAALPVVAAVGGMAVPALLFVVVNLAAGPGALQGWAIPTATDIAFALAVLAVVSTHLPAALRTFLLTLAVVDDLLAITIIAIFYTRDLHPLFLLLALVPLAVFGVLVQRRIRSWWLLLPLAVVHLGTGARLRCARHGRRCAARLHRPGAAESGRGRTGRRPGAGRAFRAPVPAAVGRVRGTGLRVLRRRRHRRRAERAGRVADRHGRDRHHRRPCGRQDRSASSARPI